MQHLKYYLFYQTVRSEKTSVSTLISKTCLSLEELLGDSRVQLSRVFIASNKTRDPLITGSPHTISSSPFYSPEPAESAA